MPRKNAREALAEIKADDSLRRIPIVVLTTSNDEEDIRCSYDLGASSFITKGNTSVTVNLKPGTYTFFCQAPGHRAAGMVGTLTVK